MDASDRISCKALLFDLEGVLVQGKKYKVLPGAREILELVTKNDIKFKIVTNNTTETPESLVELLSDRELYLNCSLLQSPLSLLKRKIIPGRSYMVLGSEALNSFIEKYGGIIESEKVHSVICGGGYQIERKSMSAALSALTESNADLITLHRNRVFTDQNGKQQMCVGAIVAALEFSSGRSSLNLGKPSPEYYHTAVSNFRVPNDEILMISDDPFSDLEGAKELGFKTCFILTGKYQANVLENAKFVPDFIVENLSELIERLTFH